MKTAKIDERRRAGYFPYYKLQWWDETINAWRDIQRRYTSLQEALNKSDHLRPLFVRVMVVERSGRHPLVS